MHQSSALPVPAETEAGTRPGHPFLNPRPANRRVSIEILKARVRRYNGDLELGSETFGAALVLIAGAEYGQNVDLLARRTGYTRAFVARCARRLIDNGVWHGGRTTAEWEPRDPASGTFWNDVAVAEGKMCRRARPDGSLEWAPAGYWNKNFHFLDPDAEDRPGNQYLDSAPEPASARVDESDRGNGDPSEPDATFDPDAKPAAAGPVSPGPSADAPAEMADDAMARNRNGNGVVGRRLDTPLGEEAVVDLEDPVPSLRHVFRDAVWLG